MKADQITRWLLAALLVGLITLAGFVYSNNSQRLDRIEQKVEAIQQQYAQIAEIRGKVTAQGEQLSRIEKWLYDLLRELKR